MSTPSTLFDAYYYQHNCGDPYQPSQAWMSLFEGIAKRISTEIQPTTVLDAGCAMGFLVKKLRLTGINAFGVDISEYAIEKTDLSIKPFVWVGSVTEPFPQKYDLIVSIEVLEHMPKTEAEQAIENFCRHTDDILFSSTPFDYKEITHINVQPPDYWMEQFARQNFYRDVDFDASFITPWAVRLRRKSEPLHRIIREYDRKFWMLNKENFDLRVLAGEMQIQIAQYEQRTAELENRWTELEGRASWRFVQTIQKLRLRLAPKNSHRARWLGRLIAIFKTN